MKRLLFCAVLLMLVVWLLWPTSDIATPDWDVLVTDTEGHPIAGAEVAVFSQQYTFEFQAVETTKVTGLDGRVHFDARRVRATGLRRLAGVVVNLGQGAHASFGVHTHLHAYKDGYGDPMKLALFAANERNRTADGSAHQSAHVVLLHCPDGYRWMGCTFPIDPEKPVLPFQP